MLASPNGNTLWTCDTMIAKQLYSSPTVQAPVNALKWLDIWGPTISTVEGQEWKLHRRVITQGFNSSTYAAAWKEAIHQTNSLIDHWTDTKTGGTILVVHHWTSRLVLHVLSGVLFNRRIDWNMSHDKGTDRKGPNDRMSFETALFTVVSNVGLIFVAPRALLQLPIKYFQEVRGALADLTHYMQDMRSEMGRRSREVAAKPTKSLLESIVIAGMPGSDDISGQSSALSENSILGDIFVTLLAGHETAGNTLAFIMLLLAIYPEYQEEIQIDLDRVLESRPQEEWSSENDFPTLYKGILGAVIKEVLRQYCVIQFGIRTTIGPTIVTDLSGKQHRIPENTTCVMNFSAAFQNPAIWSRVAMPNERRKELHYSHAIDFDPRRWLRDGENMNIEHFWPFAAGYRKCPGRHFAQVEIVGVLAALLKNHSIELMVDEESLRNYGGNKEQAWKHTRDRAIRQLEDDVKVHLNVYMKEVLPIKLNRR